MATIRWHRGGNDFVSQLEKMTRDMDRLLSAVGPTNPGLAPGNRPDVYPPLNVYNDGECFIVRAEVPGIHPKEIDIEVTGDTLTLRGERKAPEISEGASYHRRERDFGRFRRSLSLPDQVDSTKVAATCNDGILEVRLPHAESTKRRKIDVKAG